MIDNFITKIIDITFRHQIKHGEKNFWDTHWTTMIKYYHENNEIYEINNKWDYHCNQVLHTHYRSIVKDFSNLHCIECGCGGGYESALMAKDGAKVSVLDYSIKALEYVKLVNQRMGVSNKIEFIHKDIFNFIPKNKFDLAWNCGVVEHYKDDKIIEIVKKMSSSVKENGLIMITVPNLLSPQSIYWMIKGGKSSERYIGYRKLITLMKTSGLKNVQIRVFNYWLPSFLPYSWAVRTSEFKIITSLKCLGWLFTGIGTKS